MLRRRLRIGFTLIELIVVVSILALLMALTAIFLPNFQQREIVTSGADTAAGALLAAKMRAKRDGKPTGVRVTVNSNIAMNTPTGNGPQYNQLTVIQQPDDYGHGRYLSCSGQTATFSGTNLNFTTTVNGVQIVNPGDYLELNGGGFLYQIASVSSTTLTVASAPSNPPLPAPTTEFNTSNPGGSNYRIIRAAQVLAAEPTINLPSGVIFDFQTYNGSSLSQVPSTGNYDILFAPSGSLVGAGANSPIYLLLRQADGNSTNVNPYSNDLTSYFATILAVEPRTGFIASHPVSPSSDPYAFTRDGQSSGL